MDLATGGQNDLTLQGDYYSGQEDDSTAAPTLTPPTYSELRETTSDISGGN